MARMKTISLRGTAERHSDAVDLIPRAGDVATVRRGALRSLAIRCPDGCGEVISVNLDPRTGPAWKLFEREGRLTLYPSVWRENGCEAHFILWRDRLMWCDGSDSPSWRDDPLKTRLHAILPPPGAEHLHFEALASRLDVIPWEALWACQSLVADRVAVSSAKGSRFGLAPPEETSRTSKIDRRA
jgi:hypothetical protein